MEEAILMKRVLPSASRYTAADYAGQILQQCMDMIRYQPPATNLTVPTSAAYGENVTPGSGTGDREHELWRRGFQVCSPSNICHKSLKFNNSAQSFISNIFVAASSFSLMYSHLAFL